MVVPAADVRLSRLLRRDAGAEVERLYRKHSGEVLRYALLVLRSRSDAEDVTQAVFMRALRAIERGEKVRAPRNWLIKIAHNECRRLLSSRKATVELPEQLAAEPEQHGQADELKRALEALPDSQRQALVLRELEGRSYAEIGATLSLSVSAVETLIFRARRSMREQLEGAMSCQEFAELLADPSARSRIRAHARVCAACATLERQARGRKSALKRIASALGLPWWAPKVAAVAVTTATVAGVATAVPPKVHHVPAPPPAPALVERTVAPVAATPTARPLVRRARPAAEHSSSPVVAKPGAAGAARPAASRPRPAPVAASPARVPAPAPEPPAAAAPAAPAPAPASAAPAPAAPAPAAPAPAAADQAPATPPPAAPSAPLPAPALPVPVLPPVDLPAPPPAPPIPVPVPDPPPVTVPAVTVPTVAIPLPPPPPLPTVPGLNVKTSVKSNSSCKFSGDVVSLPVDVPSSRREPSPARKVPGTLPGPRPCRRGRGPFFFFCRVSRMSVINRRNAVIGWLAWTGAKTVMKRKAKDAVPAVDTETKRPNKSAIALALATAVGVLTFVKRRSGSDDPESDSA